MPHANFLFKIIDITFSPHKDLCKVFSSFLVEIQSPIAIDGRIKVLFNSTSLYLEYRFDWPVVSDLFQLVMILLDFVGVISFIDVDQKDKMH